VARGKMLFNVHWIVLHDAQNNKKTLPSQPTAKISIIKLKVFLP
jgi:hypothetical protein